MAKPKGGANRRKRYVRLFDRSMSKKVGLPPGTMVPIGGYQDFTPWASLLQFRGDDFNESIRIEPSEIAPMLKSDYVNWVNVEGVHDAALVHAVSAVFDLHPLTQEDLVNTTLRPQFETFPGYYFFALKMLYINHDKQMVQEQISLILKGNTLITFQETPGDVFGKIRERIRSQTGKMRSRGADYLLYILIDSIVDGYYQVVDHLAERVDHMEEEMRSGTRDTQLARMFEIRRETLFLRKNIMPVRDLLNKVQVEGTVFLENTKIYLKDLSDHISQVSDALNLSREMTNVLIETYHSIQNQKLNGIMMTLTMISTVFLPLNFIAGVYGMNFKHMPELNWDYGYPLVMGLMVLVLLVMLGYFTHKGWILTRFFRKPLGKNPMLLWEIEDETQRRKRAALDAKPPVS